MRAKLKGKKKLIILLAVMAAVQQHEIRCLRCIGCAEL